MVSLLENVSELLRNLSLDQLAVVRDWLTRLRAGESPGIETDPRVCGGEPCIVRTRIPVWTLEQAQRLGMPESEILRSFPTLQPMDLVNARACARAHPAEIAEQIRLNEEA